MAKRQRSLSLSEPRPCAPQHRVLRNSEEGIVAKQCTAKLFSAGDIRREVLDLIERCTPGVWLRVLPLDEDNDSLCFHTGQERADVQPCLQECGLVTTPGHIGGKLSAPIGEWLQFAGSSAGAFEVGTARPNRRAIHIFIMKKPEVREAWMHSHPIDQLNDDDFDVQRTTLHSKNQQHPHYFRHCRIHLLSKPMEEAIAAMRRKLPTSRAPIDSSAAPIDTGITLTDSSTAPICTGVAPIDSGVLPIDSGVATIDTGAALTDAPATVTPAEKRRLWIDDEDRLDELGNTWESAIAEALSLDLEIQPRPSRNGIGHIELHNRKLAAADHKLLSLSTANAWGWSDHRFDYITRRRIAEAACRQVSYDFGYKQLISYSRLPDWEKGEDVYIKTGDPVKLYGKPRAGRPSYVSRIEAIHPGYLRELYRYAENMLGNRATFSELADCMNQRSDMPTEERETLSLHPEQLRRWFHSEKGKQLAASARPRLTDDQRRKRIGWSRRMKRMLVEEGKHVAYLDEKWFHPVSNRRKIKFLQGTEEELAADESLSEPKRTKSVSRKHECKVMHLGVVARPMEEYGFDGKIFLERVAEPVNRKKASGNQRFTDDAVLNAELKDGSWCELYVPGQTAADLAGCIADCFELDAEIAERLQLKIRKRDGKFFRIPKESSIETSLERFFGDEGCLADVELEVYYKEGEAMQKDVPCDSKFMLGIMGRVGKAVREKFSWVPAEETVYLVMDNAGGHGTSEAIKTYTQMLMDEYNIEIFLQVPRSPETNLLDLGIWRSIQSAVEKEHAKKTYDPDSLARSVQRAWDKRLNPIAFGRVADRLLKVLDLIVRDNGDNNLVESERGKLFSDPIDTPVEEFSEYSDAPEALDFVMDSEDE
jgi:hypothetical protein